MNSRAADRIRAMKAKGTITEEQAEELLGALPDEVPEEQEGPGTGDEAAGREPPADVSWVASNRSRPVTVVFRSAKVALLSRSERRQSRPSPL